MNYQELGDKILALVGGRENVTKTAINYALFLVYKRIK